MVARFAGRHVVITRPRHRAEALAERLRAAGARVSLIPAIRTEPADPAPIRRALAELAPPAWLVFTSRAAVEAVAAAVPIDRWPASLRVAAVGPATARALARRERSPDLVAQVASAAGLLAEPALDRDLEGTSVLLPLSDRARPELAAGLRHRKARVEVVVAYRTVPIETMPEEQADELRDSGFDAILFASPSAVRAIFAIAKRQGFESTLRRSAAITIGPTTSAAVRELGATVVAEAEEPGDEGFWRALCRALPSADPSS